MTTPKVYLLKFDPAGSRELRVSLVFEERPGVVKKWYVGDPAHLMTDERTKNILCGREVLFDPPSEIIAIEDKEKFSEFSEEERKEILRKFFIR